MASALCTHLIFDLDGTLIDSAPSILTCFSRVMKEAGIVPKVPLGNQLIGPPLAQTLQILTGIQNDMAICAMTDSFKTYYDSDAYRDSLPYEGLVDALHELKESGYELILATNKRIVPTRLILGHLGWDALFSSVWALDCVQPKMADKTAMLGAILDQTGANPVLTAYVGDKTEDGWAADANGMRFVAALWGYGQFAETPVHWLRLGSPAGLVSLVRGLGVGL